MKPVLHVLFKPFYLRKNRGKQVTFSRTGLQSKLINPQFVTFLESSKFQRVNLDKYERKMRRRAAWMRMSLLVAGLLFGWFVIESAQAISLF